MLAGFFANTVMGGNTSPGNDLGVGTCGASFGGITIRLVPFLHGPRTFIGSLVVALLGAYPPIAVRRAWARRRS